jgi:hypothetical protein
MSFTGKSQILPPPATSVSGKNCKTQDQGKSFEEAARQYAPVGAKEPSTATVSRYAMRVVDLVTGEAYSADELSTATVAAAVAASAAAFFPGPYADDAAAATAGVAVGSTYKKTGGTIVFRVA